MNFNDIMNYYDEQRFSTMRARIAVLTDDIELMKRILLDLLDRLEAGSNKNFASTTTDINDVQEIDGSEIEDAKG